MGDVYRARDTRLDREVALKTVKGPFTERFEREARAISALNHPNICTLYDVGEHEGSGYLVMEYIEGKPVAGPLPVEQAIALGIQICEALDAAHKKGIVHRDLKPANILQTKAGVKLLDFGLAKLMAASGSLVLSGSGAHGPADQATVAALTGAHTVVGTPQYMAPEQIEGKEVDARTDIFAFGCVLYELLTGKRAFEGKSASTVMASVLAMTPRPIGELIPLTPPALERIVSRCLAKDPDERWQTIRDVASELRWVVAGRIEGGSAGRRRGEAEDAAVAGVGRGGGAGARGRRVCRRVDARRARCRRAVVRFQLPTPEGVSGPGAPSVSPDGRYIVFSATDKEGKRLLWLRALDTFDARPLSGTDGRDACVLVARQPVRGVLRRRQVEEGRHHRRAAADHLRGARAARTGRGAREGVILFDGRGNDPIWRVPATGGIAKPEVNGTGGQGAGWPVFLPDGKRFLYMDISRAGDRR